MKKEPIGEFIRACTFRTRRFRACGGITTGDFCLPKNSSFWLRSSAGKSLGDFTSPFSSFYFGAFGNNYIDHGTIDRYRDYYSFPAWASMRSAGAASES